MKSLPRAGLRESRGPGADGGEPFTVATARIGQVRGGGRDERDGGAGGEGGTREGDQNRSGPDDWPTGRATESETDDADAPQTIPH